MKSLCISMDPEFPSSPVTSTKLLGKTPSCPFAFLPLHQPVSSFERRKMVSPSAKLISLSSLAS